MYKTKSLVVRSHFVSIAITRRGEMRWLITLPKTETRVINGLSSNSFMCSLFPGLPGSGAGSQCNNSQVEGEDSGLCRGSSDLFTRWGVLLSYIHLYTSASRAHNGSNLPINKHYTFCENRGENMERNGKNNQQLNTLCLPYDYTTYIVTA